MASSPKESRAPKSPTLTQNSLPHLGRVDQFASQNVYPALLLFEQLTQGGFSGGHKARQATENPEQKACRDFLDSFSYLCDVEKGGATVTAAAIQQRAKSYRLWLAANDGIRDGVKAYAEAILEKAKRFAAETANRQEIREDVFQLAVEKCRLRLTFYRKHVRRYAEKCLEAVEKWEPSSVYPVNLFGNELTLSCSKRSSSGLEATLGSRESSKSSPEML
jgi:hypothetical protein